MLLLPYIVDLHLIPVITITDEDFEMARIGREELINVVQRILDVDGSEEEINALYQRFIESVPDPQAGDFFVKKEYDGYTARQIVDKSFDYKPIILPPSR